MKIIDFFTAINLSFGEKKQFISDSDGNKSKNQNSEEKWTTTEWIIDTGQKENWWILGFTADLQKHVSVH